MGLFDYTRFIMQFSERTVKNNNYISEAKEYAKVYEVTQTINSMFGIITLPFEKYKELKDENFDDFRHIDIRQDIYDFIVGLEKDKRLYNDYTFYNEDKKHVVYSFIKHIKNSLSHSGQGNLNFTLITDDPGKEITHVLFHDEHKASQSHFYAKISIKELNLFLEKVSQMYNTLEDEAYNKMTEEEHDKEKEDYDKIIKSWEDIMKSPTQWAEKTERDYDYLRKHK